MNHMRSANEAERQKGDKKNKKIQFGKKETLSSFIEELKNIYIGKHFSQGHCSVTSGCKNRKKAPSLCFRRK